ncbi:MAG: RagB/SusD family nutrient uptake outer membrane protein [Prevotellaceae bacterium]|jgi:hypothetical protein|nr:RagB/SusD family nutrient uptake outer membrane protein [Prevotellaceae bacterium]
MKKIFSYAVALAFMSVVMYGCKLVSSEYSDISSDLYPTSERDARDLVTSNVYEAFRNDEYAGAFNVATGFHLLGDMATDFGFCSWGESNWGQLEYANFQNPDGARNPRMNWAPYLPWISKMELTIDRIKGIAMDETLKKRYLAELECGQGFMAFLIWDFYGPIILSDLETLKKPQDEIILPRQTNEQTIAYIESKLKAAAEAGVLAKSYSKENADYGRFTEGLCHTLLLKLYMQTKQWPKAIVEGRELMKPEYSYELVTDAGDAGSAYANVFSSANEGNKETIWAVNCLREYQSHLWYPHVISWGGYKMTRIFFETFESGDDRCAPNVITDGGSSQGVLPLKYDMVNRTSDNCYTDWIVYRYADVITLLAEAIVQQGNAVTQEAIDLLNEVRTRASLPPYQMSSFTNKDDFIDKLLWERAHELWYEGCRRQDLIRNNKYVTTMAQKCVDHGRTDYITALGTNAHLFPLPSSAVNEGRKGGFNYQNPGYGD